MITFEQLSEKLPDEKLPPLDRENVDEGSLTEDQLFWRKNGFLIKENFIPQSLIDAYCDDFERSLSLEQRPSGYNTPTPYMSKDTIKDLCLYEPLSEKLKELIGHEMGMHLNLTGWKSTERNFHQDDYLNPPFVMTHYAAVWFALDDIHEDSGPFEYIPGSHKWPLLRRDKVLAQVSPSEAANPAWPATTERFVVPAVEAKIAEMGMPSQKFIAKKGDILIWHGALVHRGTKPNNPDLFRKTIITHFSSLNHRQDMQRRATYTNEYTVTRGNYFVF